MRQDSAGIWNPSPAQVIDLASYEVGDTGITFCQSPEANYLAAAIGNSPAVIIFTENQKTGKFEFFQKVVDPQISEDGVTIPYSEQHVRFASDFAWEVGKCNRFAIGAMSMFDGPDGAPLPYGRVYVFTLTGQPPAEGSGNVLTIVLGVIGGAVVLIVIVFAVVYFRKRKLFARDAASEKLLMGGELSTTTE
jgi:hypothetical protein